MSPITLTLIAGAFILAMFFTNLIPPAVAGVIACVFLQFTGVLNATQAWSGLSQTTVLLFGGMLVLGAGFSKTSFIYKIKNSIKGLNGNPAKIALVVIVMGGLLGSLTNATTATAIMIPIMAVLAVEARVSKSKFVKLACDAACIWVSTCPWGQGIQVASQFNSFLTAMGLPEQFELMSYFKVVAVPKLIATVILVFIGWRLLPDHSGTEFKDAPSAEEMEKAFGGKATQLTPFQDAAGIIIFFGTTVLMILSTWIKTFTPYSLAILGACLMCVCGVLKPKEWFQAINMQVILLFVAMYGYATAMNVSGTATAIGEWLKSTVGTSSNAYFVCFMFFIVPAVLTQFMNNIPVQSLFCPLEAGIAVVLGINPMTAIICAAVGAQASFLTPMSSAQHSLAFAAGGYTLKEYLKEGLPFFVIYTILMTIFIPIFCPPF